MHSDSYALHVDARRSSILATAPACAAVRLKFEFPNLRHFSWNELGPSNPDPKCDCTHFAHHMSYIVVFNIQRQLYFYQTKTHVQAIRRIDGSRYSPPQPPESDPCHAAHLHSTSAWRKGGMIMSRREWLLYDRECEETGSCGGTKNAPLLVR